MSKTQTSIIRTLTESRFSGFRKIQLSYSNPVLFHFSETVGMNGLTCFYFSYPVTFFGSCGDWKCFVLLLLRFPALCHHVPLKSNRNNHMKKTFLFLATILAIANLNAIEPFKSGRYVTLQGGGNYKTTQLAHNERVITNFGGIASTSIGVRNKVNTRYEFEFAYRYNALYKYRHQSISGHVSTQAYMVNLIYDFPTVYFLKPYIGFGGGYARQLFNGKLKQPIDNRLHLNKHTNTFAWQGIAGFACPLDALDDFGCDIESTVEYKFFNPRIKSSNDQSITLGLRTYF